MCSNILNQQLFPIELLKYSVEKKDYSKIIDMIKAYKKAILTVWHPDRNPLVPEYIEEMLSMLDKVGSDESLLQYYCEKAIYNHNKSKGSSVVIQNSPNWSVFKQLLSNQEGVVDFSEANSVINALCTDPEGHLSLQISSNNSVELSFCKELPEHENSSETPLGVVYEFNDGDWVEAFRFDDDKTSEESLNFSKFKGDFNIVGWIDSSTEPPKSKSSIKSNFNELGSSGINTLGHMFIEPEHAWFIEIMNTGPLNISDLENKKLILFDRESEKVALMPTINVCKP